MQDLGSIFFYHIQDFMEYRYLVSLWNLWAVVVLYVYRNFIRTVCVYVVVVVLCTGIEKKNWQAEQEK